MQAAGKNGTNGQAKPEIQGRSSEKCLVEKINLVPERLQLSQLNP